MSQEGGSTTDVAGLSMDLALSSSEANESLDSLEPVKKKRKKKKPKSCDNGETSEVFSEETRISQVNKKQRKGNEAPMVTDFPSVSNVNGDRDDGLQEETTSFGRKRLLFPTTATVDYHDKFRWALRLSKYIVNLKFFLKKVKVNRSLQ